MRKIKKKGGGGGIYSFYSVIAIAGKLRIIRRINLISMEFIVLGPKAVKIYKVRKAGGGGDTLSYPEAIYLIVSQRILLNTKFVYIIIKPFT